MKISNINFDYMAWEEMYNIESSYVTKQGCQITLMQLKQLKLELHST